jgi:hypothetical protein
LRSLAEVCLVGLAVDPGVDRGLDLEARPLWGELDEVRRGHLAPLERPARRLDVGVGA